MVSGAYTHAYSRTLKVISRNQAHAGLWPACAWFKNTDYVLRTYVHSKTDHNTPIKQFR